MLPQYTGTRISQLSSKTPNWHLYLKAATDWSPSLTETMKFQRNKKPVKCLSWHLNSSGFFLFHIAFNLCKYLADQTWPLLTGGKLQVFLSEILTEKNDFPWHIYQKFGDFTQLSLIYSSIIITMLHQHFYVLRAKPVPAGKINNFDRKIHLTKIKMTAEGTIWSNK